MDALIAFWSHALAAILFVALLIWRLGEAARQMVEARRKVLPVVDTKGVLVGIVDRAHLLAAAGSLDAESR